MGFSSFLLSFLIATTCLTTLVTGATLVPAEVTVLQRIANSLKKTDWNFSVDPCSGRAGWSNPNALNGFKSEIVCNCSSSNNTTAVSVCHVVRILLKSQNLTGVLPTELVQLPYLQEFDVSRNYLNGTIPPEWGLTNLVQLSVLGNRLTGSIPKELGNISTLSSLVLQYNQFSGTLPPELGNLHSIQRMFFSSNFFTGEVPASFANLTSLKDFRIDDNLFTGKIPDFVQYWTHLEALVIEGSGLSGPIPSGIAQLVNISELRITDLGGTSTTFPPLSGMKNLVTLILRSCNIIGELPSYLGTLTNLKLLDLSFNNLTGNIPSSYTNLQKLEYIYLTGNLLSGSIPSFVVPKAVDLSYNNFSLANSQQQTLNLFGSPLSSNNTGTVPWFRNYQCQKTWYSVHINCGGHKLTDGNTIYEADLDESGPAMFYRSASNWAISNTGHFFEANMKPNSYLAESSSKNMSQLYMSARLSPLSLTYYAFCLGNGNYTVDLHFAEIIFTDDETYSSLGRRIFDVYIQGDRVLKDFNIAAQAGGVGVAIVKQFPAVVEDTSLEIRFHWAGRGTVDIPDKGIYGPLISAISVNPNFTPPSSGSSLSVGIIVGVVVAAVIVVFLALFIVWWRCFLHKRHKEGAMISGSFTLRQIKAATNNFRLANKIGEGGFGSVYKGVLANGTLIAVKQLSSESRQGNREFVNEVGMISSLQHPHLVQLYGCCTEKDQLLLVYEYMENNSLARALFGPEGSQLKLDWPIRQRICVGIARGLAYLHEESTLKIVHRDIKATNVLLDKDLSPKISDFGLAKLDDKGVTHVTTRVAGTYGYMAPEYAVRGHLTDKADVYSFGIVALEIVSGRSNTSFKSKGDSLYLLDWALVLKGKGQLMDLVDPRLESNFDKEEVITMINVGLLCASYVAANRPTMSSVVGMLEGRISVPEFHSDPVVSGNEWNLKTFMDTLHAEEDDSTLVDSKVYNDGTLWTASTSAYPDSDKATTGRRNSKKTVGSMSS